MCVWSRRRFPMHPRLHLVTKMNQHIHRFRQTPAHPLLAHMREHILQCHLLLLLAWLYWAQPLCHHLLWFMQLQPQVKWLPRLPLGPRFDRCLFLLFMDTNLLIHVHWWWWWWWRWQWWRRWWWWISTAVQEGVWHQMNRLLVCQCIPVISMFCDHSLPSLSTFMASIL